MKTPSKIKIVYIITKSNWGGAQRYVYDLAKGLDTDIYEPIVVCGGSGEMIYKLKTAGIRIIQIRSLQRDISFFKEIQSFLSIGKIIKKEKPHVLHINSSKAGGIGTLMGRLLCVPRVIFTSHGWAFNEKRSHISRVLIKALHWVTVLLSHKTIAVSQVMAEQMNWPLVKNKMVVVHNGRFVPQFYSTEQAREMLIKHTPVLETYRHDFWSVTIGELHPIKQHAVTIKAFSQIIKKIPTARHLIISEGEERVTLEALIKHKNLQEHVFLMGALDEAAQYLKAFDLFVLSSRSEGLAYVIIEACFAGLPIIASDVGGIPEIIRHEKEGALVPSGDIDVLQKTYTKIYTDSSLQKRYASNAEIRSRSFTLKKMIYETTKLYT